MVSIDEAYESNATYYNENKNGIYWMQKEL